jgi:flagellar basal-body rod protein FlgB
MLNKLDAALSFHETALRVRGQRQELIAANIANADTPNYKARDIDFTKVMKNSLNGSASSSASSVSAVQVVQTNPMHLSGTTNPANSVAGGSNEPLFRPIIQGSVDGNTVDMDIERNQFADNGIRYEASLNMINGQIKKLMSAIQGQ